MVIGSKDLLHKIMLNHNEVTSFNEEKLLSILLDRKLNFKSHRGSLFRKEGQKMNVLAKLTTTLHQNKETYYLIL